MLAEINQISTSVSLTVCKGLPVSSVTEAKSPEISFTVSMGGLSQPGYKLFLLLSNTPAAALLCGGQWARWAFAKLDLFQWTLSKHVSVVSLQSQEGVDSGPNRYFYKGYSPSEVFMFSLCSQCEQNVNALLSCLQNQSMHYGIISVQGDVKNCWSDNCDIGSFINIVCTLNKFFSISSLRELKVLVLIWHFFSCVFCM